MEQEQVSFLAGDNTTLLSVKSYGRTRSVILAKRGLTVLPDNLLDSVSEEITEAEDLDLSNNSLSDIGEEIHSICGQLRSLDISRNKFQVLPSIVPALCVNLKILFLQNNQISCLPPEFELLTKLEELYLCHNKLTEFPPIAEMAHLSILDVSHNSITTIDDNCLSHEYCILEELYIGNNELEEIPAAIGTFTNLLVLDLSNNRICEIPECLDGLVSIRELYLQDNKIKRVPQTFTKLKKLTEFNLSSNVMSCPPTIVCKKGCTAILKYLEELSLGPRDKQERKLSRQTAFSYVL